jgi:DNA-binding response OmpR family regulator
VASRVLLIEDEANIAEAIRFILGRDGLDVAWSADGADLAGLIRSGRPDAVILDLMLPGRSGLDLLAEMKADPATRDIPVMMLTAKGQGRDRQAAERAGAQDFMTKPFANAEMRDRVRALIAAGAPR